MYGATLAVIADWLRTLNLPALLLQPRGFDAHEVALTVRTVQYALRCQRIIAIGGGLEGYLEPLRRALRPHTIPLMELVREESPHAWDHARHAHASPDLHLWLDVARSLASCERILDWARADGLITPSVRQGWRQTQLRFLQIQGALQRLRPRTQQKAYVAVHDAYRPLTRNLGMRSLGSLQTDEETPPNLQKLRQIILKARREPTIFVLSHTEQGIGVMVARILRVPLVLADTLERVDPTRDYFQRFLDLLASIEAGARIHRG